MSIDKSTTDSADDNQSSGAVATNEPQVAEKFENPGLAPHVHRMGDTDPKAAKRSERIVVGLFVLSILASIGGILAYFMIPLDGSTDAVRNSTLYLGLGIGFGFLGIGLAAVHWAKSLMSDVEQVEERKPQRSDDATRADALQQLQDGAEESGVKRRPLIKGALAGALLLAPLAALVPLIGNLGKDWDISRFRHTIWGNTPERFSGTTTDGVVGRRLARDPQGTPIRAADVTRGSIFHVVPEGMDEEDDYYEEKAKAVALIVRVDPNILVERPERESWSYEGIVAYSKICTHVGCPVALYEQQTHHLLCPCHQSTFDVTEEAKVVFGPATRPLPQLPIAIDTEGYLIATSDFTEPIGPSYWERLRHDSND